MFTIIGAPVIATKGHYYQIDPSAVDKVATIVDKNGKKIEANGDLDDTFLGME